MAKGRRDFVINLSVPGAKSCGFAYRRQHGAKAKRCVFVTYNPNAPLVRTNRHHQCQRDESKWRTAQQRATLRWRIRVADEPRRNPFG